MKEIDRRTALGAAAIAGISVPLLAACGNDTHNAGPLPQTPAAATAPDGTAALVSTRDVPVGGGVIVPGQQVVVTQPTAGEFKCFSAICTHQKCPVTRVTEHIDCTCHGSQFSIEDGSVVKGPAKTGLAEQRIAVTGDAISLA